MSSFKHAFSANALSSSSAAGLKKAALAIFASAALFSSIGAGAQTIVTGTANDRGIRFYDVPTGNLLHTINNASDGGLALGADGYVYSEFGTNVGSSVIYKINKSDYSETTFASGVDYLPNLHFDSHGSLWAASAQLGSMSFFDSNGNQTQSSVFNHAFMTANRLDPTFFGIDASDNFYLNYGNPGGGYDIKKYSSTGTLLNTFGHSNNGVSDLEFDSSGNLYTAQASGGVGVREYDTSGSLINSFSGFYGSLAPDGSGGFYETHKNFSAEVGHVQSNGQFSTINNNQGGGYQLVTFGSAVPEPGAIALGVGTLSLGGLAFLRKRRHSRR